MDELDAERIQRLVDKQIHRVYKPKLMTGQEWYDRFEVELKGKTFLHGDTNTYVVNAVTECMEAARRAAGLNTEGGK